MEFPNLGKHCANLQCNNLDFLPFLCDECKKFYCVNHHKYESHSCPKYQNNDVKIPICPLCDNPVPNKPGQCPDIVVNLHLENGCRSLVKKMHTYKCSEKNCKSKEMVAIKCDICHYNFCLKHRHSTDHNCRHGQVENSSGKILNNIKNRNWVGSITHDKNAASTHKIQHGLQASHSENSKHLSILQGNKADDQAIQRTKSEYREAEQPTPIEDDDISVAIARSLADMELKQNKNQKKTKECVIS